MCAQAKCWTKRESWHVGKSNRKIKRGKARNNVLKCPFQTFACYWGSWLGSISVERMVLHAYAYVCIRVRCFRMAKKHADNSDLKNWISRDLNRTEVLSSIEPPPPRPIYFWNIFFFFLFIRRKNDKSWYWKLNKESEKRDQKQKFKKQRPMESK